MILYNQMYITI